MLSCRGDIIDQMEDTEKKRGRNNAQGRIGIISVAKDRLEVKTPTLVVIDIAE